MLAALYGYAKKGVFTAFKNCARAIMLKTPTRARKCTRNGKKEREFYQVMAKLLLYSIFLPISHSPNLLTYITFYERARKALKFTLYSPNEEEREEHEEEEVNLSRVLGFLNFNIPILLPFLARSRELFKAGRSRFMCTEDLLRE
jgi:hypothetical protein